MLKSDEIIKAADLLRTGGLVAFPTETVYGLGADATQEQAIRQVFAAKQRPYDHPLIVHVADSEALPHWAREVPPAAKKLAQAFWPGPLTLVLKKQPHVLDIVTGGQDTVGVRIPRHPVALALLKAFGGGVVAPSANQFTHVSPTTSRAVAEELGDRVGMILEGGECEVGLESTIVDVSGSDPLILRPGMVTRGAIEAVLGCPVSMRSQDVPSTTRAPGMHHVHYAPTTTTWLMASHEINEWLLSHTERTVIMAWNEEVIYPLSSAVTIQRMPHHAEQYAHDLYQTLRSLDQQGFQHIVIEQVPNDMAWDAIRDRLTRASGRRN